MPINLYSTATTDALLADKLSDSPIDGSTYGRNNGAWAIVSGGGLTISTLSNAATATLNAGVPTAGQALTYDGTDLIWATVSGSVAWGAITGLLSTQTDLQSELDLKANLVAPSFTSGITVDGGVTIYGPSGNPTFTYSGLDLSPMSGGITFGDATVQSTAAAPAGANFGDAFTLGTVQNVTASGGYWIITFRPVNDLVIETELLVSKSDGTSSELIDAGNSSTSTWTYTTDTLTDQDTIYITYNYQRSSIPIGEP